MTRQGVRNFLLGMDITLILNNKVTISCVSMVAGAVSL